MMNSIRAFATLVSKSLSQPSFYTTITQYPVWFSVKYFFVLCVCLGILYSIGIFTIIIPGMHQFWNLLQSPNYYPDDLVVRIENGTLRSNNKNPVTFPFPEGSEEYSSMVVIDPQAQKNDIEQYDTVLLVTRDAIISHDAAEQIRTYPLDDFDDMTITQKSYNSFLSNLSPWVRWGIPVFATLLFLGIIMWLFISHGLFALLFSAIPFSLSRLKGLNLTFKNSLQISLHAYTLILILQTFLTGLVPGIISQLISVFVYSTYIILIFQKFKKTGKHE